MTLMILILILIITLLLNSLINIINTRNQNKVMMKIFKDAIIIVQDKDKDVTIPAPNKCCGDNCNCKKDKKVLLLG